MANFSHSLDHHVTALQAVLDAAGDVDGLLKAIARCEGEEIARAAYAALVAQLPGLKR